MLKKMIGKFIRFIEPAAIYYQNGYSKSIVDELCFYLYRDVPWHWYREDKF